MAKIRIGCSGWSYQHWRGLFYPEDLPASRWFDFYADHFDTVELNNSFYRLPKPETFRAWRDQAPGGFCYAVKANRYITHTKKLKDPEEPLRRFFTAARELGPALGPVLYQLPPRWKANAERLEAFLGRLPDDVLHVFEFRDQSWHADEILDLLDAHGAAFCTHDMPGLDVPRRATGPAAYVRFHGATGKYQGRYGKRGLKRWAERIAEQAEAGRDVWAYFNNDPEAHAIADANDLAEMLA